MRRQPALVGQKTPQKIQPLFAPQPDLDEILHAGQSGAQHQQENFWQRIHHAPLTAAHPVL